jgi:outer membrane protein assembly factor BamB
LNAEFAENAEKFRWILCDLRALASHPVRRRSIEYYGARVGAINRKWYAGVLSASIVAAHAVLFGGQASAPLPAGPLSFGAFTARFLPDGTFALDGEGWPPFKGTWKTDGQQLELIVAANAPEGCGGPGRYQFRVDGRRVSFDLVTDGCEPRKMILDHSSWLPAGDARPIPPRHLVRTTNDRAPLPAAESRARRWPSFRGEQASGVADGQHLPDTWDVKSGANILWRTSIAGLAHSSPVVWGDLIFVTSAISSRPNATFRPGLYGDGDASDDRSRHRWMVYAIDARTGRMVWERTAFEGEPLNKRHIKSTYASASPATDGRIVVAWFGSQGVYAYDYSGALRWKVNLGRVDMGAYDIPTFEWGPASSPIIWNGLVILQCDTQADSFIVALNADTGDTVWKTDRDELPSWGTPTVVATPAGPQLVTNASNFIRGYDPRTGKELWKLGRSSKITAPTPISGDGLLVVASGRGPERPLFVVRPDARGDLTLRDGETRSAAVVWSRTGRGSYMPTPLFYNGLLYVLANNGVFDAYQLKTGEEVYRQRLPAIGSGYSASPVAADGKIYLANEDGEMLVIGAGDTFKHIATSSMGEPLMATPALVNGVMYVRSASTLFAIGRKR